MLTGLTISNFKSFEKSQTIPIKPITLIFGENSSGKSSIIHSLLFSREVNRRGHVDFSETELSGDTVDFGGLKNLIHGKVLLKDELQLLSVGFDYKLNPFGGNPLKVTNRNTIRLMNKMDTIKYEYNLSVHNFLFDNPLSSGNLSIDNKKLISFSNFKIDPISKKPTVLKNEYHPHSMQFDNESIRDYIISILVDYQSREKVHSIEFDNLKKKDLEALIEEVLPTLLIRLRGLTPTSVKRTPSYFDYIDDKDLKMQSPKYYFAKMLPEAIEGIVSLTKLIRTTLNQMIYLGPFRNYPPRHFYLREQSKSGNWDSGGGSAWEKLLTDDSIRERINMWLTSELHLGMKYRWKKRKLFSERDLSEFLQHFCDPDSGYGLKFDAWSDDGAVWLDQERCEALPNEIIEGLKSFSPTIGEKFGIPELVLEDSSTGTILSHKEVGIGVSQIMPVIVQALGNNNRLICIEEPDIHVHPGLQAKLGDLFIESAIKHGNTLILETHSEHLLLRLLRRIKEGYESDGKKFTSDDLSVIYTKKEKGISEAIEMEVDKKGKFKGSWPKEFFDERSKEIF